MDEVFRKAALDYHRLPRPGKLAIEATKRMATQRDLALAYSPGVAAPVKAIAPPAGQDWTQTVSKTAEGYVMGNPAAPIKVVEYGSRLCPVCKALATDGYQPLTDHYVKSGKVSFEFREFLVHGAPDMPPALLGTCVGPQPFFPLLEQMFANQESFEEALQKSTPAQQQAIQSAQSTPWAMACRSASRA